MGTRATAIGVLLVMGAMALAAWAADGPEVKDWDAWRVQVHEYWPGAEYGWDWAKGPPAGIGLWRQAIGYPGGPIEAYRMGWMAEGDEGRGVAGMLEGEVGMEQRVEVAEFGRQGKEIGLTIVVHPVGGVLPEGVKEVVRRKLGKEGSRVPVTFKDGRAVNLGGKKVLFAGAFPQDLPAGEYRVRVRVQDEKGQISQQYEKRLVKADKEVNPLAGLSDGLLLAVYIARGEALKGTDVEPIDFRYGKAAAATSYNSPASVAWRVAHGEIVKRGGKMVPALMKMLEAEAIRNPGDFTHVTAKFGFAFDVMRMLEEIGDSRPVTLLQRVMVGMDGKANSAVRVQAAETADKLTFVTFLIDKDNPATSLAMMHDWAAVISSEKRERRESSIGRVAELYGKWLNGEGRDPARWLPLARERAHKALEGNDALAIRNAIAFLTGNIEGPQRDDAPEKTVRAIAGIMARKDRSVIEKNESYVRFPSVLACYGPAAREYVESMIDQVKRMPSWDGFRNLCRVGGERAMSYMVSVLPGLKSGVEHLGVTVDVDDMHVSDVEAGHKLRAYQACRWGIERWAGRVFGSDEEIAAWWEKAKDKGQQQWLEEDLERTSAEADRGSAKAQYIIRAVVPDLPDAEGDRRFFPPWNSGWEEGPYRENGPGPFREKWVKENRARLVYDSGRSCFVLGK